FRASLDDGPFQRRRLARQFERGREPALFGVHAQVSGIDQAGQGRVDGMRPSPSKVRDLVSGQVTVLNRRVVVRSAEPVPQPNGNDEGENQENNVELQECRSGPLKGIHRGVSFIWSAISAARVSTSRTLPYSAGRSASSPRLRRRAATFASASRSKP